MLTNSERFAFRTQRVHGFATTGNAYDACQVDEALAKGHTLLFLDEWVAGLAWAWPAAITAEAGHLHRVADARETSLAELIAPLGFDEGDVRGALALARALDLAIDPVLERVAPAKS